MALDHEAIYEAYKTATKPVVSIDDSAGAFAADGSKVTLSDTKIAAARKALDDAAALIKYKTDRTTDGSTTYAPIGDQLDLLWHAIDADADLKVKFSAFYNSIKAVKDANPKP